MSRPHFKRPRDGRRRRGSALASALTLLLALTAMACGDSGGGSSDTTVTGTAAVQTNPVFVAAGTSNAAAAGRVLRLSVGSPLPVGQTAGAASRQLALGPNAIRP